jgi:hypothetical protein
MRERPARNAASGEVTFPSGPVRIRPPASSTLRIPLGALRAGSEEAEGGDDADAGDGADEHAARESASVAMEATAVRFIRPC